MRLLVVVALAGACAEPDPVEPPPPPPPTARATAVTYGAGRFAMLWHDPAPTDDFGQLAVMTSTDGESWQEVTRLTDHGAPVGGIAFADGRFVAVGSQLVLASGRRASALTSTDGVTWTRAEAPNDSTEDVASIAGTFVAASPAGLATSPDGVTWTSVPGTMQRWWSPRVMRAGNKLFAFGEGPAVFETEDARTWAAADTGLTVIHAIGTVGARTLGFGLYDCCFGEVADGIMHIQLHRDIDTWRFGDTSIAYPHALFDVGAYTLVATDGGIAATVDGETLEPRASADTTRATFASDGAGTIVMTGGGVPVASHDNGLTWTRLQLP